LENKKEGRILSSLRENEKQQKNIDNVLKAQQNITSSSDSEFSLEENVQEALAKSRNEEARNNQPTYEPNKAF
jgi:hypothetical protein